MGHPDPPSSSRASFQMGRYLQVRVGGYTDRSCWAASPALRLRHLGRHATWTILGQSFPCHSTAPRTILWPGSTTSKGPNCPKLSPDPFGDGRHHQTPRAPPPTPSSHNERDAIGLNLAGLSREAPFRCAARRDGDLGGRSAHQGKHRDGAHDTPYLCHAWHHVRPRFRSNAF